MRPPAIYFLVSAAAHAAVFASLSGPGNMSVPAPPRPLQVRLALAPESRPVLPAAVPARPVQREPTPTRHTERPMTALAPARPAPQVDATPVEPVTFEPDAMPTPIGPADTQPTAEAGAPSPPVTERIALQRPVVPVAVTETSRYPDPALVEGYARILSDGVARMRRYPAVARMRGWQGTVVVNVTIGAQGELLDLKVSRSSGHEILDQQALAMIREARPLPPAPAALRGLALVVQLPVTFALSP